MMINTLRLLKVSLVWITLIYIVCFIGVALFPSLREAFMLYSLHTDIELGRNVMTFGTFLSGLIVWNVITFVAVWLFATLYNRIKQ